MTGSRLERVENLSVLSHLSCEWSLMLHHVAPGHMRKWRFFFFLLLGFKQNISDQWVKAPSGRDLLRIWMWSIWSSVVRLQAVVMQEVLLPVTIQTHSFCACVCCTELRLKGSDVFLTSNLFSLRWFQAASYKNKARQNIYYTQSLTLVWRVNVRY